ncbi:MAG: hypothetical protein IJC17_05685 [Clostridia bacterium]|nr:hypothetical protein [Clostridia bacterium]
MLTVRKRAAMLCCLSMLFGLAGCNGQTIQVDLFAAADDVHANAPVFEPDKATVVADNGAYTMEYDPAEDRVNFRLKSTGALLWSTGVTEKEYGQAIENKMTQKALKQYINVKYTDFGKKSGAVHNGFNGCETTLRRLPDGIRFDFDFTDYDISLALELTLTEKGFSAAIPKNSIDESGKYKITGLDVLPMLGATLGTVDGYIFLPDGCGALYRFGKPETGETMLSMDVYDDMLMDLDASADAAAVGQCKVAVPVFGIKHPEKALFANIVSGEESCSIILQTDGGVYKVNRAHPAVRVRKQYAMTAASGSEVYAYEKENYVSDIRIDYTFLNGKNCGYSEMAAEYRSYLVENGMLSRSVEAGDTYPMAVDFLFGVQRETMLYDEMVTTATFEQTAQMLKELTAGGATVAKSILYGWQKNGYYAYPPASSVAGSAGGKSKLSALAASAPDTAFYLLQNYVNATEGQKGFSTYTDVVYQIDSVPLTDEEEEKYLLNLGTQEDRLQKDLATCEKVGAGLATEGLGSLLYEDYEKNRRITRYGFKQQSADLLKTAREAGVSTATDGFAPYLAAQTDYVFNLTSDSSHYMLLDEDVPFVQMVLHGYVAYSDALPGNLSEDLQKTKLEWVEYGYMPTFMLTYQNSDHLKDTDFNLLFSSEYDLWKEEITAMGAEFTERLSTVFDSAMVRHQKADGVARVQYENGTTILINYNETDVTVDGTVVKAMDYAVIAA